VDKKGNLTMVDYTLTFELVPYSNKTLKLKATIDADPANVKFDFIRLQFNSTSDEEIYGMGLQYTVWNFKGLQVPVISSEGGVGRGLEPLTEFLNLFRSN